MATFVSAEDEELESCESAALDLSLYYPRAHHLPGEPSVVIRLLSRHSSLQGEASCGPVPKQY